MLVSAFISSHTRKLLSSVYWDGDKHKELMCNHSFVGALVFKDRALARGALGTLGTGRDAPPGTARVPCGPEPLRTCVQR